MMKSQAETLYAEALAALDQGMPIEKTQPLLMSSC
jgi:hypothetical protein